jgi:hypothetical protein
MGSRATGVRTVARVVLVLWLAFWSFFSIASGVGEAIHEGRGGLGDLAGHLAFTAVIGLAVVMAWRRAQAGGLLLVLLACFGQWYFHPKLFTFLFSSLILPPAVAGVLLILATVLMQRRLPRTGTSTS